MLSSAPKSLQLQDLFKILKEMADVDGLEAMCKLEALPEELAESTVPQRHFAGLIKAMAGEDLKLERVETDELKALRAENEALDVAFTEAMAKKDGKAIRSTLARQNTVEKEIAALDEKLNDTNAQILAWIAGSQWGKTVLVPGDDAIEIGQNVTQLEEKYGVKKVIALPASTGEKPYQKKDAGKTPIAKSDGNGTLEVVAILPTVVPLSSFCKTLAAHVGNPGATNGINATSLADVSGLEVKVPRSVERVEASS